MPVLGWDRLDDLITAYGRPISRDRLRCYWWLVPVPELLPGPDTSDDAIISDATAELGTRLSAAGRARRA